MIKIVKKVLDELAKESPNLDYIRGMLETVVEMESPVTPGTVFVASHKDDFPTPVNIPQNEYSEEEIMDRVAKAKLKEIQEASIIEEIHQK